MVRRYLPALIAITLSLASAVAAAQGVVTGDITVDRPWMNATPPYAHPKAGPYDPNLEGDGFMTIVNSGSSDDRLIAVVVDPAIADKAALMNITKVDGKWQIEHVDDGLVVPAGGTVKLSSPGIRIDLDGLKVALKEGDRVPLGLTFQKAGKVKVVLSVIGWQAEGP